MSSLKPIVGNVSIRFELANVSQWQNIQIMFSETSPVKVTQA